MCDLAWIVSKAENLVGHHLQALRDAGLAVSRRDGKIVFYALTAPGRELGVSPASRADNDQRIASFIQTSDQMSGAHEPTKHGAHRRQKVR